MAPQFQGESEGLRVAVVQFEQRGDDIYAFSDDIPGLNICGKDHGTVLQDVIDGIKFIYSEFRGMHVNVEVGTPPEMALPLQTIERLVMRPAA